MSAPEPEASGLWASIEALADEFESRGNNFLTETGVSVAGMIRALLAASEADREQREHAARIGASYGRELAEADRATAGEREAGSHEPCPECNVVGGHYPGCLPATPPADNASTS